jgi:hypothetical protein
MDLLRQNAWTALYAETECKGTTTLCVSVSEET